VRPVTVSKRNVKVLYRALSRVYDVGDRIYMFGFSRGAFTVRTLAGLIGTCGIVKGESCGTTGELRRAGRCRLPGVSHPLRQPDDPRTPAVSGRRLQ
jgi:hypothetical protein